jgi:hypothetical protein
MIRIKIPAMRATTGWNAGWTGILTLRMRKKSAFWESIEPYAVIPHDLAFRVGTDAGQARYQDCSERPVSVDGLLVA